MSALFSTPIFSVASYVMLCVAIALIIFGALRIGMWWLDRVEAKMLREFNEQQMVAEAAANAARQATERA